MFVALFCSVVRRGLVDEFNFYLIKMLLVLFFSLLWVVYALEDSWG